MKIREFIKKEETEEEMWKELANLLKIHVWTYPMSDDFREYQKGQKIDDRISYLSRKLEQIDKKKVIEYYKKYIPKDILKYHFPPGWEKLYFG